MTFSEDEPIKSLYFHSRSRNADVSRLSRAFWCECVSFSDDHILCTLNFLGGIIKPADLAVGTSIYKSFSLSRKV